MSITPGERITTINHILREVQPLMRQQNFIDFNDIERLTGGGVHSRDLQEIVFDLLRQPLFQGWAITRTTMGAALLKVPIEVLPAGQRQWLVPDATRARTVDDTNRGKDALQLTLVDLTYFMVPQGAFTGRTFVPLPQGTGENDIYIQVPFSSDVNPVKVVRALTKCYPYSLREAKAIVDQLRATGEPIKIFEQLSLEEARAVASKLMEFTIVGASEADFEGTSPPAEPEFPQEAEVLQYLLDNAQSLRGNLFGGDYGWLYKQITEATGADVWDLEKWDKKHGYTYYDPDEASGFLVDVSQTQRRLASLQEAK